MRFKVALIKGDAGAVVAKKVALAADYSRHMSDIKDLVDKSAFVRFKVLLSKGDVDASIAEIQRLTSCRGFDPEILRVRVSHHSRAIPPQCARSKASAGLKCSGHE